MRRSEARLGKRTLSITPVFTKVQSMTFSQFHCIGMLKVCSPLRRALIDNLANCAGTSKNMTSHIYIVALRQLTPNGNQISRDVL